MKYRKKPVIVEAWQWDGDPDYSNAPQWVQQAVRHWGSELEISTLEGVMLARPADWLIKGVKGEVYPCKPDIFELTYEYDGEPVVDILASFADVHERIGRLAGRVRALETK